MQSKQQHKSSAATMHSKYRTQLQTVYDTFFATPCTMKECDKMAGIMRESICRYCRALRHSGVLHEVGKRKCHITHHIATVYTTNPAFAPASLQLKLPFPNE